jgi:hypothetical protein
LCSTSPESNRNLQAQAKSVNIREQAQNYLGVSPYLPGAGSLRAYEEVLLHGFSRRRLDLAANQLESGASLPALLFLQ